MLHHHDPYAAVALLKCEQIPQPFGLYTTSIVLGSPFPGYALGAFSLFALTPYILACSVWLTLSVACVAYACVLLPKLCRKAEAGIIALLAVAYAVAVIPYGQLSPIILCSLCGAALALRRGTMSALAIGLAITALEPHVALPVFLALFIWRRDTRGLLLVLCAALLLLHVAVDGPAVALSYFTQVLPAHDTSEVGFLSQFSFTWIVQALGASVQVSLVLGNIAYAVLCGLGIWLSGALARRYRDPAFFVLIPAACAVMGGSYVHYSEVLLALPAALLLFVHSSNPARVNAAAAVILIGIPWLSIVGQPAIVIAAVAGVAAICVMTLNLNGLAALRAAFGAALLCALILLAAFHYGPNITTPHGLSVLDVGLADAARAAQIAKSGSSGGIVWWIAKLPTWIGLVALLLSGALAVVSKIDTSESLLGNILASPGK